MKVSVRLSPILRDLAGSASVIEVELAPGATVADALDALAAAHPGVGRRVRDEQGQVRRHVNVFVASDNIRDLDGQATPLTNGTELNVIPAVSGG